VMQAMNLKGAVNSFRALNESKTRVKSHMKYTVNRAPKEAAKKMLMLDPPPWSSPKSEKEGSTSLL
jgi:hypothetical protein